MAGLTVLLNVVLREWIAPLHLAVVVVFTAITVGLVLRTLIVAIADRLRRSGEDSGESGGGHGGPDDPPRGLIKPEPIDPRAVRHWDSSTCSRTSECACSSGSTLRTAESSAWPAT